MKTSLLPTPAPHWASTIIVFLCVVGAAFSATAESPNSLADLLQPALRKDLSQVSKPLTQLQQRELVQHFQPFSQAAQQLPHVGDGLEAVLHAKGMNFAEISPAAAAQWLERPQGHGAYLEQKVANAYSDRGFRVAFTKAGNVGTDLLAYPTKSHPMTFLQAKATQTALASAEAALLDGLAFAGGSANRPAALRAGTIQFRGIIPSDQLDPLIRKGLILADGTPTAAFVEHLLNKATESARGTGTTAERLRVVLPDARKLLPMLKVEAGPLTYPALLKETQAAAQSLRTVATQMTSKGVTSIAVSSLRWKMAGGAAFALAAEVPELAAAYTKTSLDYASGRIGYLEASSQREHATAATAFSTSCGLVLLACTPVGWVAIPIGLGAGLAVAYVRDDVAAALCKLGQSPERIAAREHLGALTGERAGYLSGWGLEAGRITDPEIRASYLRAWEAAGRPAAPLPAAAPMPANVHADHVQRRPIALLAEADAPLIPHHASLPALEADAPILVVSTPVEQR